MNINRIAEVASLIGEPARAAMLAALMDDRALTAAELAREAGITPQTASTHLARLTAAHLLRVHQQGRHRYHRLATPEVARMLEGLIQIAWAGEMQKDRHQNDTALRTARICYDHIAGKLGVAIAEGLVARRYLELNEEAARLTHDGIEFLVQAGIALSGLDERHGHSRRLMCRPCLDWSERRFHLGGRLGAAIFNHSLQRAWVRRLSGTRALETTQKGRLVYQKLFGIEL
jgi:DNA-binding transcriptional ArsR family regulator